MGEADVKSSMLEHVQGAMARYYLRRCGRFLNESIEQPDPNNFDTLSLRLRAKLTSNGHISKLYEADYERRALAALEAKRAEEERIRQAELAAKRAEEARIERERQDRLEAERREQRAIAAQSPSHSSYDDDDDEDYVSNNGNHYHDQVDVNPTTGLPIYGGGAIDVGGYVYGQSIDYGTDINHNWD